MCGMVSKSAAIRASRRPECSTILPLQRRHSTEERSLHRSDQARTPPREAARGIAGQIEGEPRR